MRLVHGRKLHWMSLFVGYFDNVDEWKLNHEENPSNLFVHLFPFYLVDFYEKYSHINLLVFEGIRSIREYFEMKVKSEGYIYFIERSVQNLDFFLEHTGGCV